MSVTDGWFCPSRRHRKPRPLHSALMVVFRDGLACVVWCVVHGVSCVVPLASSWMVPSFLFLCAQGVVDLLATKIPPFFFFQWLGVKTRLVGTSGRGYWRCWQNSQRVCLRAAPLSRPT